MLLCYWVETSKQVFNKSAQNPLTSSESRENAYLKHPLKKAGRPSLLFHQNSLSLVQSQDSLAFKAGASDSALSRALLQHKPSAVILLTTTIF